MSVETNDVEAGTTSDASLGSLLGAEPREHRRPNVSGDLPTMFRTGPMFRRTVAGYDRFQVDTYVQWAEDELATADREREHLVAAHLRTRADLERAHRLLSHSSDGGEMLHLSERIGALLAAAADEAKSMKSEARATRASARTSAKRMLARAQQKIADAEDTAEHLLTAAAREVEAMNAVATQLVDDAEQVGREARTEAAARLEKVRAIEERAGAEADLVRQRAVEEAVAARLQARDEVVRMLSAGREARRRADAEALAMRERLDRDAATRTAALLAEVDALERRRAFLRAEVERLSSAVAGTPGRRVDVHVRQVLDRFRWRPRSLRAP